MLELYQAYADYTDMMPLTEDLVAHLADRSCADRPLLTYGGRELDLTPPWRRATMTELIAEHAGVEVDVRMPIDRCATSRRARHPVQARWGRASSARDLREDHRARAVGSGVRDRLPDRGLAAGPAAPRASRGWSSDSRGSSPGRELCNAFSELTDPVEQRARFEAPGASKGAPATTRRWRSTRTTSVRSSTGCRRPVGLGIGVDRLVMLLTDTTSIRDVILFPTLRPEVAAGE